LKGLVDLVGNAHGSIKSVLTVTGSIGKSFETGVINVDVNVNFNVNATASAIAGAKSHGIDG
jgi:hypothetical protein